jgi:hypothetical protein
MDMKFGLSRYEINVDREFCLCSFGLRRGVYWLVGTKVSEKRAVSIFKAEVMSWDNGGEVTLL